MVASNRLRDNQRAKVYAWERVASKKFCAVAAPGTGRIRSLHSPDFKTLDECIAFATPIWSSERGRYGLGRVKAPAIERPSWGQRSALAHHDHRITLPRWSRGPWVILHELAHRLTPANEAHGARFCGVLIGLLARHCGYDAHELMSLADDMGVKYSVRSIGAVPIESLSTRLTRLLPISEIEAAVELDVTWRQVRGAAINLIRGGHARWFRGRLVPIERQDVAAAKPKEKSPAPARKLTIRQEALELATKVGVEISKERGDPVIWVYPPGEFQDERDPYIGEHYCDDWVEALSRVKIYAQLVVGERTA